MRRLRPGPGQDPQSVAADQRERLQKAMTELVHEGGYPRVTVRELLSRAHVTKPTFYRLFSGKEDCFYATYAQAISEAFDRTEAATRGSDDRRQLLGFGLATLGAALIARPADANLVLLEPLSVGRLARARMRRVEAAFADLARRRFAELDEPVELPPLVARGLISGIGRVARRRVSRGRAAEFGADVGQLVDWALAISDVEAMSGLAARRPAESTGTRVGPSPDRPPGDERAMLVSAAARLATERGYEALTVADILATAGVSRPRFEAHFESVDDCFFAAVELGAAATVGEVQAAYRAGPSGSSGVARAIHALCAHLAGNPEVARLLFVEVFRPGRRVTRRGTGILTGLATLLRQCLAAETPPSEQSAEASVGAIWSLIRHEVERGRVAALPRLAPVLVWFALAPSSRS